MGALVAHPPTALSARESRVATYQVRRDQLCSKMQALNMPDQSCKMHPKRIQKIEMLALRMRNSLSAAAAAQTTKKQRTESLKARPSPARRSPSQHHSISPPTGYDQESATTVFGYVPLRGVYLNALRLSSIACCSCATRPVETLSDLQLWQSWSTRRRF